MPITVVGVNRGVKPDVVWLTRQMQLRCWTLRDFAEACEVSGRKVSAYTISRALNDHRIDGTIYATMIAAIEATEPILPEAAIA